MKTYRIAAINLGSTSTKFAYYENETCVVKENLIHKAEEIKTFATIWDQYEYRLRAVEDCLQRHGIAVAELDAVVTRGGHSQPLEGGVYRINPLMLEQSASMRYGNHACDLGLKIAVGLSAQGPIALTVDPPTTDEFEPLARYSGLPELPRRSSFHALNHKAVARQYAREHGTTYAALNLIVVHMGGGISVAAHQHGRAVDANNGLTGDGPFSTNRTGTLPVGALVDLCFSGTVTHAEMRRKLNGLGGMMAYLGENDTLAVEQRADAGDAKCSEVLDAMCYQVGKEIGACAAVLHGAVDAILMTGGMANSKRLTETIAAMVRFIAPVHVYPGEFEMQSLALSALEMFRGNEPLRELQ
ncbi:MAG: butyrate kinase [Candidatus Limiplasma sp.]|nr:butyrate kinase [Candidatus Limiplasma sp.]